jgi:hypothetical protein
VDAVLGDRTNIKALWFLSISCAVTRLISAAWIPCGVTCASTRAREQIGAQWHLRPGGQNDGHVRVWARVVVKFDGGKELSLYVHPSDLAFSLSSHRYLYITLLFSSRVIA